MGGFASDEVAGASLPAGAFSKSFDRAPTISPRSAHSRVAFTFFGRHGSGRAGGIARRLGDVSCLMVFAVVED